MPIPSPIFESCIFLQYYQVIQGILKVWTCHFALLKLMAVNEVPSIKASILFLPYNS